VLGDTHPNTCNTSLNLASLYLSTGQYADAASAARASYDGYLQSVGPAHAETARATRAMIKIYEAWGKPKIAAEWRAKLTNVAPSP
jgi:ATP/maltotriose-dependent transcriptional regulator MalT